MALLPLSLLTAFTLAACSAATPYHSSAPSEPTLCRLQFGRSTVSDATTLLGTPMGHQTFLDGSGFLDYQFGGGAEVLDLQLEFGADQVLTGATTLNIPRPACWSDAGDPSPAADGAR